MNKKISNTKNTQTITKNISNKTAVPTTKNSSRTSKNLDHINNNIKNTVTKTANSKTSSTNKRLTPDSSTRNRSSSSFKTIDNTDSFSKNTRDTSSLVGDARIYNDQNYVVLVWQNKNEGIVRRVMEVQGSDLSTTLQTIRDQRKSFSYYMKR